MPRMLRERVIGELEAAFPGLRKKFWGLDVGELAELVSQTDVPELLYPTVAKLSGNPEDAFVGDLARELCKKIYCVETLSSEIRSVLVPAYVHTLVRASKGAPDVLDWARWLVYDTFILLSEGVLAHLQQRAILLSLIYFAEACCDDTFAEQALLWYLLMDVAPGLTHDDFATLAGLLPGPTAMDDQAILNWFDGLVRGVSGRLYRADLEKALFSSCREVSSARIVDRIRAIQINKRG